MLAPTVGIVFFSPTLSYLPAHRPTPFHTDSSRLDKAVIYVLTGWKRIIYLGGDKRREKVEVLDMIVAALKVIAKVASLLINAIREIVMNMLKPFAKQLDKLLSDFISAANNLLISVFKSYFPNYNSERGGGEGNDTNSYELYSKDIIKLFLFLFILWSVAEVIENVVKVIFAPALVIFAIALSTFLFLVLWGIVGDLFTPQTKPYTTYNNGISEIPELEVDKIPSDKWWLLEHLS